MTASVVSTEFPLPSSAYSFKDRFLGHILVTRPAQLIWLDIVLGVSTAIVLLGEFPPASFLTFVLISVIADAGACTFNDLGDYESDRRSIETARNKRPVVLGQVSHRGGTIQGLVLYLLSLALAFTVSPVLAFVVAIALIWGFQYSFAPAKMDGRPIVAQLFWLVYIVITVTAIYVFLQETHAPFSSANPEFLPFMVKFLPYLLYLALFCAVAETLVKDIRDIDNDQRGGKKTTTVFFGFYKASRASWVFASLGLLGWYGILLIYSIPPSFVLLFTVVAVWFQWRSWGWGSVLKESYDKGVARKYHISFILTMAALTAVTALGVGLRDVIPI